MNNDIKTKWVEGLRSGEFKQGTGRLHRVEDGTFCCLGVLCKTMNIPEESGRFQFQTRDRITALPPEFLKSIELPEETHLRLMRLNDTDGCSFDQIADYIERTL